MTKRENDTSASEASSDETERPATTSDADALFDVLVAEDVLSVGDDGEVRTTDGFDDTHAIYHDSYVGVDETEFHESVATAFGLPDADAGAELVAERGISREEFVQYLAVRSHVDRETAPDDLAVMAGMVGEVVPDSPVPSEVADVTDDPRSFLTSHDRAVVSVWKRFCDPCEALKRDFDAVLDAVPDDVSVAGIDGERAVEFCETHGVEAAPRFVLRRNEQVRTVAENDPEAATAAILDFFSE